LLQTEEELETLKQVWQATIDIRKRVRGGATTPTTTTIVVGAGAATPTATIGNAAAATIGAAAQVQIQEPFAGEYQPFCHICTVEDDEELVVCLFCPHVVHTACLTSADSLWEEYDDNFVCRQCA